MQPQPGKSNAGDNRRSGLGTRIGAIAALTIAANVLAWLWAFFAFRHYPVLVGTAFLAYTFGIRHAVDADHIAAIDNVTRTLMQRGERPVAVGWFFSLGHSTVVFLASAMVVFGMGAAHGWLASLEPIGGLFGTSVSAGFLLAISVANARILQATYRALQRVRRGGDFFAAEIDDLPTPQGPLGRLFGRTFRLVTRSWHMYPIGFLFGLGFDTATEIGLLGISAAEAFKGLPIWSIVIFPALFTAGMALVDTADGILMLGTYGWALSQPIRRLYYNLIVTLVSILVALIVGGIELFGLAAENFRPSGPLWTSIGALNAYSGSLGYVIVAVFATVWVFAVIMYRRQPGDKTVIRLHGVFARDSRRNEKPATEAG